MQKGMPERGGDRVKGASTSTCPLPLHALMSSDTLFCSNTYHSCSTSLPNCLSVSSEYTATFFFFFNTVFRVYLFLERGEGKEKEGEKYQCVVASRVTPAGDLACNPGMCPDWDSNHDPLVHRPVLNPLSYTNQDSFSGFYIFFQQRRI